MQHETRKCATKKLDSRIAAGCLARARDRGWRFTGSHRDCGGRVRRTVSGDIVRLWWGKGRGHARKGRWIRTPDGCMPRPNTPIQQGERTLSKWWGEGGCEAPHTKQIIRIEKTLPWLEPVDWFFDVSTCTCIFLNVFFLNLFSHFEKFLKTF